MRIIKLIFFCMSILLLLSGCQSAILQKFKPIEFNEQLYVNAKMNFTIKHPLDWKIVIIQVSSPKYRDDTVLWRVENPHKKTTTVGTMLIKSSVSEANTDLHDILSSFLAGQPELTSGQAKDFVHHAGAGIKLVGHDAKQGRLTIALQGEQHNFIISLDYPNDQFDKLFPVFQDIVASFAEIKSANDNLNRQLK